jgi:hypothetical protein
LTRLKQVVAIASTFFAQMTNEYSKMTRNGRRGRRFENILASVELKAMMLKSRRAAVGWRTDNFKRL